MAGRPYEVFQRELNLPHSLGAIFIAGNPDNLEKTEKYYYKYNTGHIFTSQIRSLLFGTKISPTSIAFYINSIFVVSAILFSLLVGYLVFKNGYTSIVVFLFIAIFRNYCQGLIYGLPYRYTYAVINPILAFSILIIIILFLRNRNKKFWVILIVSGFIIAYIEHFRTSEKYIIVSSLIAFIVLMLIEILRINRQDIKKILISTLILFTTMCAGYFGYQIMIREFEHHRDKKYNLPPTENKVLTKQSPYHSLFLGLFRFPNKFNYVYQDITGYNYVYKKYPELEKKYSSNNYYRDLVSSEEYYTVVKELYFDFVLNNPKHVLTYLYRSIYDYVLFLPYYTWTGKKSAHAYLPKINENVEIEPEDLAPDFKTLPDNWILNLKIKYLPNSIFFWVYFVCAYALLIEAIYTSFITFKRGHSKNTSLKEAIEINISIYLLWGMLIYFFFASIVRILIPTYGHSAVVAFNVLIIYNLVRIIVSARSIRIKHTDISLWLLLLVVLIPVVTMVCIQQWVRRQTIIKPVKCSLSIVSNGSYGKCFQIKSTEYAISYAYCVIPTVIDKKYRISAYFKRGTSANGQIKVGNQIDSADLYYSGVLSDPSWTRYSGVFKANAPNTFITLVNLTILKGQTSLFDDVTLKDIETDNIIFHADFDKITDNISVILRTP